MPPKAEKAAAAETKSADPKIAATRQRDLDAAISHITKAYGDGSIMRLGDAAPRRASSSSPPARCPWTWPWASAACRAAGWLKFSARNPPAKPLSCSTSSPTPEGRRSGCFYRRRARPGSRLRQKAGVNLDELLVSQPDSGEEALSICETLARSNALDVIVIDSVAALVPKAELEGEMGMATMACRRAS